MVFGHLVFDLFEFTGDVDPFDVLLPDFVLEVLGG
jgi:hypothetical protein